MINPKFITFEGGEGSGKSTQVEMLARAFKNHHFPIVCSREPGGSIGAEEIRNLIVSGRINRWQPKTEVFLHSAARIEHVTQLIEPALSSGKTVICDRFFDSTFAYQGFGYGIDLTELKKINEFAIGKLKPDVSVILDLPVSEGLKRARARNSGEDRYEKMKINFHEKVRQGFFELARQDADRFEIIDASDPITTVHNKILELCREKFMIDLG